MKARLSADLRAEEKRSRDSMLLDKLTSSNPVEDAGEDETALFVQLATSSPKLVALEEEKGRFEANPLPPAAKTALADAIRAATHVQPVTHASETDRILVFARRRFQGAGWKPSEGDSEERQKELQLTEGVAYLMCTAIVPDVDILKGGLVALAAAKGRHRVRDRASLSFFSNGHFAEAKIPSHKIVLYGEQAQIALAIADGWCDKALKSHFESSQFSSDLYQVFAQYPVRTKSDKSKFVKAKSDLRALARHFQGNHLRDIYVSALNPVYIPLSDAQETALVYAEAVTDLAIDQAPGDDDVSPSLLANDDNSDTLSNEEVRKAVTGACTNSEKARVPKGKNTAVFHRGFLKHQLEELADSWADQNKSLSLAGQLYFNLAHQFAVKGTPRSASDEKLGSISRISSYLSACAPFFLSYSGAEDLLFLDGVELGEQIERFLEDFDEDGASTPRQRKDTPKALRVACEMLFEAGFFDELPVSKSLYQKEPVTPGGTQVISYAEYLVAIDLLSKLDDREVSCLCILLLMLGFHGGLRFGEAYALRFDQLFCYARLLEIEVRTRGGDTKKTRSSNGTITGFIELTEIELEVYKSFKDAGFRRGDSSAYLFRTGSSQIDVSELTKMRGLIREALFKASGQSRVRFHTLRHTYASLLFLLYEAPSHFEEWLGADSKAKPIVHAHHEQQPNGARQHRSTLAIASRMRHASFSTTFRYYIHNAHIVYAARAREVPWAEPSDEYLSWITFGKLKTGAQLSKHRRSVYPEGFTKMKPKRRYVHRRLVSQDKVAIEPLRFFDVFALLFGRTHSMPPEYSRKSRLTLESKTGIFEEARACALELGLPDLLLEVEPQDLLVEGGALVSARWTQKLEALAAELNQCEGLLELANGFGSRLFPKTSKTLAWSGDDVDSLPDLIRFLEALGFSTEDMTLILPNGQKLPEGEQTARISCEHKPARWFRESNLSCATGFELAAHEGSERSYSLRKSVEILCFCALVWVRQRMRDENT